MTRSAMPKGEGDGIHRGDYCSSQWMLSTGLTMKVTFEQGREGGDRKSHVSIYLESVPGREN